MLLEAFADRVEVSVRDEGPGIPEGRLEEAAAEGRLGVSESIRGPDRRPRRHRRRCRRARSAPSGSSWCPDDAVVTIHTTHPFADADPDPARRLRGRLGGAVSLWTAGAGRGRAGLTVTSLMLAHGEPPRLLALVDPDSDLADAVERTGRAVVPLLSWHAPRPRRGVRRHGAGPGRALPDRRRSSDTGGARGWSTPRLGRRVGRVGVDVGWSLQLTCVDRPPRVGDDDAPLLPPARTLRDVRVGHD